MWRSVETDHVRGGARGRSAVGGGLTVSIRIPLSVRRGGDARRAHAPPACAELDGRVGANPCHDYNSNHDMDWSEHGASRGMSGWWDPKIVHSNAHESRTRKSQPCAPPACLNRTPPRRAVTSTSRRRRGGSFEILRVAAGVHGSRRTRGYAVMHQHAPCRMFDITHNTGGCGVPLNSHTPFHKPPAPRTNRHARTTMSSRRHVRSISSPLLYKPSGRLSKRAS